LLIVMIEHIGFYAESGDLFFIQKMFKRLV